MSLKFGYLNYFSYLCIVEKHSTLEYKLNMVKTNYEGLFNF